MNRRIVILGASNVTRGLSGLVSAAIATGGGAGGEGRGPAEVFIAAGHGRSYGSRSRVLGRSLPGILECGLWEALGPCEKADCAALITDIGNDIMYGRSPEEVVGWVEQCIARLRAAQPQSRIAMSAIPIDVISSLSPRRYAVFKALLFPSHQLTYSQAIERARELDQGLRDVAAKHNLAPANPIRGWYCWDPVHPRKKHLREVWRHYLQGWNAPGAPVTETGCRNAFIDRLRLRFSRPRSMTWLGLQLGRAQPSLTLRDGSRVHVY